MFHIRIWWVEIHRNPKSTLFGSAKIVHCHYSFGLLWALIPILISAQGISILPVQKEGCPHTSSLTRCYVLACPIQWKTDAKGCMTCGCSKYAYALSTFKVLNIEILVLIIIQRCPGANMTKPPRCRQTKLIWWIIFALRYWYNSIPIFYHNFFSEQAVYFCLWEFYL